MNLISTNLRTVLEMSGSPAEMTLHLLLLEKDLHSCFGDKIKGLLKSHISIGAKGRGPRYEGRSQGAVGSDF